MANKSKIAIPLLAFLALAVLISLSPNLLTIFQFGYNPYGESPNGITDLLRDYESSPDYCGESATCHFLSSSKYWNIEEKLPAYPAEDCEPRSSSTFSGNDFNIISGTPRLCGAGTQPAIDTFESTESFSNRDFKVTFDANQPGNSGGCGFITANQVKVSLVGDSGEINAFDYDFPTVNNPPEVNLDIRTSPISEAVDVFVNGQQTSSYNYMGDFKIKIETAAWCGGSSASCSNPICSTSNVRIIEPQFKEQFGCTTDPNEQFYYKVFPEGQNLELSDLDNFDKFCLEEAPLQIFTNAGSTTDVQALVDLTNDENFDIPQGQIWVVEYVGEITNPVTECEADEAYNPDTGECLARALISFECPEGYEFDNGICIVATEPSPFEGTDLATHQALEQNGMFRFTHFFDENAQEPSPSSFNLLGSTFSSGGIVFDGLVDGNVEFPEQQNSWFAEFNYGGESYSLNEGQEAQLNDFLSVEVSKIEGLVDENGVSRFKAEYTFTLDTSFLDVSYDVGNLFVTNNYKQLDGGLTITTQDNVGTTNVENFDETLSLGDTIFPVDITNLIEIRARPYIYISTPDYDYAIDAQNAIVVSNPEVSISEPTTAPIIDIPGVNLSGNIEITLIIITIIGFAFLIFLRIRRRR